MKSISSDAKKIFVLFLIVKVAIFLIGAAGYYAVPFSEDYYDESYAYKNYKETTPLLSMWAHWDGQWFLKVSETAYNELGLEHHKYSIAFFPLYPLITSIIALILQNMYLAGLIVSYICSFFAFLFLYRLVKEEFGQQIGEKAVFYLMIFPAALFFSAFYSEGMFLLLAILVFYFARKKLWLYAGLCGLLAASTRFLGIILLVPLLIEFFKSKEKNDWKILYAFLPLAGTAVYFAYLYRITGNFFSYFSAQQYWAREALSFNTLIELFQHLTWHSYRSSIIDLTFAVIFVVMLYFMYKKLRFSYFIYSALMILIPLSSGSIMSFTRLAMMSFPHFILFALFAKDKKFHYILSTIFVCLLAVFTIMFVNHYWVA